MFKVGFFKKYVDFWLNFICVFDFIINMIVEGYRIFFIDLLENFVIFNRFLVFKFRDFVDEVILELIECGCVFEVDFLFIFINLLYVV